MPNAEAIAVFLKARQATYVSSFRVDELSKTVILEVPASLLRGKVGKGVTSKRQLAYLKRDLEVQFSLRVVITLREAQQLTDLESGLRAMLLRKFPEFISDLYMSFPTGDAAQAWVTIKQDPGETISQNIHRLINEFLADASLRSEGVEFVDPHLPEPSTIAILRSVKAMSPAGVRSILTHLSKRGFYCPSERWLSHKLDGPRKRGLLVRNPSGDYSLTSLGLELVPHTRSGSSSDVERMLLLARRRKW